MVTFQAPAAFFSSFFLYFIFLSPSQQTGTLLFFFSCRYGFFLYPKPWRPEQRRHLEIIAYMKPRVDTGGVPCTHTAGGRGNRCLDSCWYYRYHLFIKHWKWVRNDLRERLAGQRWRAGGDLGQIEQDGWVKRLMVNWSGIKSELVQKMGSRNSFLFCCDHHSAWIKTLHSHLKMH